MADLYRKACYPYLDERDAFADTIDDPARADLVRKNLGLARRQADELDRNPALIILAIDGRPEGEDAASLGGMYGSILPAAWSLMLALRSRGLGTTWTSLHTLFADEAAELLGIPDDVTQCALLPVAYTVGDDFKPAERRPPEHITYWNSWKQGLE